MRGLWLLGRLVYGSQRDVVRGAVRQAFGKRDFYCLACLERRLQRPLDLSDFPPLPVNALAYAAVGKLCVVLEEHARSKRKKLIQITSLSDVDSPGWL
jgi:hypothetical protein